MKSATFHLLNEQTSLIDYACSLIAQTFLEHDKIIVLCQNQEQALKLDERLWQLPCDRFIPHSLFGETTLYCPVEIHWLSHSTIDDKALLINLSGQIFAGFNQYSTIIDFVPFLEQDKQLSRQRYALLRQQGYQMKLMNG